MRNPTTPPTVKRREPEASSLTPGSMAIPSTATVSEEVLIYRETLPLALKSKPIPESPSPEEASAPRRTYPASPHEAISRAPEASTATNSPTEAFASTETERRSGDRKKSKRPVSPTPSPLSRKNPSVPAAARRTVAAGRVTETTSMVTSPAEVSTAKVWISLAMDAVLNSSRKSAVSSNPGSSSGTRAVESTSRSRVACP